MRRELLALAVLACFLSANTWAQSRANGSGTHSLRCDDCEPPPGGGGGGGTGGGTPTTPEKATYFEVNPADGTFELHTNRGVVFVIDESLNKVFMSTSQYHSEMKLSDLLLKQANGNAAKANARRADLRAILADARKTAKLVPGSSHGFTSNPNAFLRESLRSHATGAPSEGLMMGGGYSFPCSYYYYCGYQFVSDFNSVGWGDFGFGFWTDEPYGGGGGTSDYDYWDIWRNGACDARGQDALEAAGGITAMAGTCEFSMTGAGAAGCYLGYLGAVDGLERFTNDSATCSSQYPGPGNWGH